jgi:hypothetical protein
MALDSITVSGNAVATDKDVNNRHFQCVKLAWGSDDTITLADASNPIPVAVKAGSALIGQVDINNYPASSDITDAMVAVLDGEGIAIGGINTKADIGRVIVNRSTSGAGSALVGAVSGKQFRIISGFLWANAAVSVKFQSDPAGTPADITPAFALLANQGFVLPSNPYGWFDTPTVNKALGLNLSAAVQVSGFLNYVQV